jgi:hypothetical protein
MVKQDKIDSLMLHYMRGRQDMDTRRTRKNGWNDAITAYMGKLPSNWPFLSVVTDPRLRTAILEKNARLINGKLRGRLVPRPEGSVIKAEIHNSILDFQWDYAKEGGSMIEKVSLTDQTARLFGAGFGLCYWDNKKNSNELKNIDPRDISWDGGATHAKNARWCQVREFTTWDKLEARGYNVRSIKRMAEKNEISSQFKSTSYESIVKANRGLEDRTGEEDNPKNPVLEIVTEWTWGNAKNPGDCTIFLPRQGVIVEDGKNPYKHGAIPIAMLRYYPLLDDIYGETDCEYLLPLQRAINATLCGFIDEMTIAMRPPLKVASSGVRIETIEYGPGAQWIMDSPNLVEEMQFSSQTIANFNTTYPALVAAFNTAMGDNSLGVSNTTGKFAEKTATEVRETTAQQNNRDQSNQNYLAEFLKDVMMFWLSNNKQYLFDDEKKKYHLVKIVGTENIKKLQNMKLADREVPDEAINQIAETIRANPNIPPAEIDQIIADVSVPANPVVVNPEETNPENYDIKPKLEIVNQQEANLYVTPEDFEGEYEYIPDVSSMGASASENLRKSREQALGLMLNPATAQLLATQGEQVDIKALLVKVLDDAGMTDAEAMFKPAQAPQMPQPMPGQPVQGAQPMPQPLGM